MREKPVMKRKMLLLAAIGAGSFIGFRTATVQTFTEPSELDRPSDYQAAEMLAWLTQEYDQATTRSRDSLATRFRTAFPEFVKARAAVRVNK